MQNPESQEGRAGALYPESERTFSGPGPSRPCHPDLGYGLHRSIPPNLPTLMSHVESSDRPATGRDFIRQQIDGDLAAGRLTGGPVTRFPPEPNGFLHIGHAKSIVLNFGLADEYAGARCHLRFDDTNPTTEDLRYVEAIQEDVRWLGYQWGEHLYFASDYFARLFGFGEELIEKGLAYVDSQAEEEIREGRGTVTRPGIESPYRNRTVEENLDLFRRMRAGDFEDGEHVLRARIDMGASNMLMRDPVLFRIRHAHHYRTGREWCVYPLYDFAHPLGDAIEGVTHSLCTLEFANNRELYDWVVENTSVPARPHQYEFARLNLDYTVMSKRKLLRLVEEGDVSGWDDPRMPTLAGLRRRGFTPSAIRSFCEMIGVAKADSRVDMGKLEYAIRDDLNRTAPRVLGVLRPLRVTLTNWPEERTEEIDAPYFPRDVDAAGSRSVPFSGHLLIDRSDFAEPPPPGFKRLVPGGEVRLRYACVIRCEEVVRDEEGEVVELRCRYDPETWGGGSPKGRKVKGTIQWVSEKDAVECEVRLYDRLFRVPDADAAARAQGGEFRDFLNPASVEVLQEARVEPSVLSDARDLRYQFERIGYFWRDPADDRKDRPVFNRIVTLRDTWARATAKQPPRPERRRRAEESESLRPSDVERPAPEGGGRRPELSPEVRERAASLSSRFGLTETDAEILARDESVMEFFVQAVHARTAGRDESQQPPRTPAEVAGPVANWLIHEVPRVQGSSNLSELPFGPQELAELIDLVAEGTISSSGGTRALEQLAEEGGSPGEIVDELDLRQIRDLRALEPVVAEVLSDHPDKVAEYRAGKTGLLGFFIGRVMGRTSGKADPERARELLRSGLED